ncbi:hypothetical protein PTKIN_Ptkin06aG0107300 [Pterospermum kingtungense]
MDYSISSLQESKAAKRVKSKKKNNKPIKVVYISNPMKVKTSASKFRALVQKLTGQDAELPDPTKFTGTDDDLGGDGNQTVPDVANNSSVDNHAQEVPRVGEQPAAHEQDKDDEVFIPQMLENFTGFLPLGLLL